MGTPAISLDECEQASELLRIFYQRSQRAIDRAMASRGASYAKARVLLQITRQGPLRSTDLAQLFNHNPRTVIETIDGLERDGLVRRDPDPDDRRAKRIVLTPAGEIAARNADAARLAHIEALFGALDKSEREAFVRLLAKLNDRVGEMAVS